MNDHITRRQFIDGMACAVATAAAPRIAWGADEPAPYPPARTGYGGGTARDFAVAHGIRDGRRYDFAGTPVTERYDVVIIGAGIGGLATAHYLSKARPGARILLLDAHDDFGGHARRNEFDVDGRFLLGYGGSESIEGPRRLWTSAARACLGDLGVDLERLESAFHVGLYSRLGLSSGLFFPREIYGVDRLVSGDPVRSLPSDVPRELHNGRSPAAFLADCPIDDVQRARLLSLYAGRRDVLAGHSEAEKRKLLTRISYHDYLERHFDLDARSLAMFDGRTLDLFAAKAVAVPALDAWNCELPGFQGLRLTEPKGGVVESDPYIDHFPDGNASLARLFVRSLIPGVAPGRSMEDIVTARFDYSRLDRSENAVRLRLSSTVVALANRPAGVDILYARGDELARVSAHHAVYAGYSAMLPYICNDLAPSQRKAVADQVKAPLVYVNVAIRNWRAWVNRGIHLVNNPAGFYATAKLDYPVSLGDYRFPVRPEEPMIVHLTHVPWPEGPITDLRSAWRQARAIVYARTFADFESHLRDELTRILGPGGFDPDRDIAAVTVNRWGHGYAYEMNPLFDPPDFVSQEKRAAQPVGKIHFAGSDAGWEAYAHVAIDSAYRAAREIGG